MQGSSGLPNTLHVPAVVREGTAWAVEIVAAPAGGSAFSNPRFVVFLDAFL